jgi:hypothetical protein
MRVNEIKNNIIYMNEEDIIKEETKHNIDVI